MSFPKKIKTTLNSIAANEGVRQEGLQDQGVTLLCTYERGTDTIISDGTPGYPTLLPRVGRLDSGKR